MKSWRRGFLPADVVATIFAVTFALNLFLVPFAVTQEEKVSEEYKLETMTVTSQKREENVQDVPVSISVFSDIQLEDAGIDNILELTRFTPNMFMKNTFEKEVIIRGIGAPRRLSEKALFPKLCVMLKKLSLEYQPYACGNFFRKP